MDLNLCKQLIQESRIAYAYHKVIRDNDGTPCDLEFIEINSNLEKLSKLPSSEIIGQMMSIVLPKIKPFEFDWMQLYKNIIINGVKYKFEHFSVHMELLYSVDMFSCGENYVVTYFVPILDQNIISKRNESRFYSLFDNMTSGGAIYRIINNGDTGDDYIIQEFNQASLLMERKKKSEVIGKSLQDLRPNINLYGLISVFKEVWQTGKPMHYPAKVYIDDEFYNWYENRVFKLPSGEIVAIYDDVTETKLLNEKLKESVENLSNQNRLLSTLLSLLPVGVFMVDATDGKPLLANEKAYEFLGREILQAANEKNIIGVLEARKKEDMQPYPTEEMPIVKGMKGIASHVDNMIVKRPDGSEILLEMFGTPVKYNEGQNWASLVTFLDITERKKTEERLFHLSYHDHLTDLFNRRYFELEMSRLDTEDNLPLSTIIGDINGLKFVNEVLGRMEGDNLIIETAEIIQDYCRAGDVLARTGGDEFSILLPNTDRETSLGILNDIYVACEIYNRKASNEIMHISLSLGYDTKEDLSEDLIQVMRKAEDYMIQHKLLAKKSSHSAIISSIKATMLEKSHETEAHAERMAIMSKQLGRMIGLSEIDLNHLELLATLHDLGKVGIRDQILNKPDKLSPEEWVEMKKHPEIGYRIAMSSPELVPIAEYILTHHERWDGEGYPRKLDGEKIPLLSRILAVVDAYDAMTEDRPYRKAMNKEDAVLEIKKNLGTQFDPLMAKIFLGKVLEVE